MSADGPFTFPVALASCASYTVTVATQPKTPDQICTVAHGAGKVGTAEVTDIEVTCGALVAVSGSVSGLKGSGLVLQLNGQYDLQPSAEGNFTFGPKVGKGTPYQVTVAQLPTNPWQTCTVTNGAGIASGDVSDVAVTCTTNTYQVGCQVSGLVGKGLVLRLEGQPDVTATGDGLITFPQKVASLGAYKLSVVSQPTEPSQTCAITDPSGAVTSADVIRAVACTTNTYAVGVTVSGLKGSGLVLRLNNQQDTAVSADGVYSFSGKVPSGGAFEISVATQPSQPWQTCAVANPSGIIAAADVTRAVTCTTNTYAVSATVSGLLGAGLTIRLNNEDVAVSTNGTVTFPTKIASGETFQLSVPAQPTQLWQTCVVTDPNGTVSSEDITRAVTCTTNSYAVGVTVSGLKGSGLVLRLNNQQDTAVSADGVYSFSGKVASGGAFEISVATQPSQPWQTCTVANPSATIAAADVTRAVTCTTNTYAVSATVSGLLGAGLTIRLNNQDVAVSTNGTVTFPTKIASGGTFQLSVPVQPTQPWQTCVVTDPNGAVSSADITRAVTCTTNTHSVGVTVSGLKGSGLVLRLNNQQDTAVSADGVYSFSGKVPSGGAFEISVATQPSQPWQTCAVANPSGIIAAADVTRAVTCTTNTYAVSATVSGLSGSGLTVRLNNQDLAVSTNGTVTFPTKIASGGTFQLSVPVQPTQLWQTCVVTDPNGTVSSADITRAVTCTTNAYSVGVTVSGLLGSGLVVRLNGATDRAVSSNGTYAFPGTLLSGASYTVTVATQPSGPLQACTPSAGSGTIKGSNVNVSVSCVNVPPTLVGPTDQKAYPSVAATFSVTASGNGPFNYVWRRGSAIISGATGPSYTTPLASMTDDGTSFSVTVTDAYSGSTSASAVLHVGTWSGFASAGPMAMARAFHTATLLQNGQVLVVGGTDSLDAELFHPGLKTFSRTGAMALTRQQHTATLLPDGTVLIVGGWNRFVGGRDSAEIYDPVLRTFTSAGTLSDGPRYEHTATLLQDGTVLITGGSGSRNGNLVDLSTAELYIPKQGFVATGSMATTRARHTATLLNDGTVLIAGGAGLRSAELFIPAGNGSFSPTGPMTTERISHTAVLLADGRVMVAGGYNGGSYPAPTTIEVYGPTAFAFAVTGKLNAPKIWPLGVRRSDGLVLIVGGNDAVNGTPPVASAELYTPEPPAVSSVFSMASARSGFTATALQDGRILVTGGRDANNTATATSELYQ